MIAGLGLCTAGYGFGSSPIDLTLDDAFISFRYAENWVAGIGPQWVEGANPVEGYTSFLWIVIIAFGLLLGFTPVWFSKFVGVLSVIGAAVLIALIAYRRNESEVGLIGVAGVALSPAFWLISVQGMETGLAALILMVGACSFLKAFRTGKSRYISAFSFLSLLAPMARPEAVVFVGVLWLALLGKMKARGRLLFAVKMGLAIFILPAVIYFWWRWNYYGFLLPNSAYIKANVELQTWGGAWNVAEFLGLIVGPYLGFLTYELIGWLNSNGFKRHQACLSVLLASTLFLMVGVFSEPIQAYLWRYQMPVYPVLILLFTGYVEFSDQTWTSPLIRGVVVLVLVFFPLHTWKKRVGIWSIAGRTTADKWERL
jgi:hypothetical protein